MRKVRTVFCPDFLAQSYINSAFTTSSACALQAFICRTHSIWFSAFSCSVTPFCSASDRTISSMRFRAASSILAQYYLTYTQPWRFFFCAQTVEKACHSEAQRARGNPSPRARRRGTPLASLCEGGVKTECFDGGRDGRMWASAPTHGFPADDSVRPYIRLSAAKRFSKHSGG